MPEEASSLHLRNAHELFLLIPIKHGFVEGPDRRTSYASRLHTLLNMLFGGIEGAVEKTLMPRSSFADKLQNIYHFHYGVVEPLQGSQLILSATFDSSWETYFRNLVDGVGPILDAVFSHCQGFEGRSCADGYEAFADFIREHQVQAGILFSATPDLTTDDLRLLRSVHRGQALPEVIASADEVATAEEKVWRARYSSRDWQGPAEFARLRRQSVTQFVFVLHEIYKLFPANERVDEDRTAQSVFVAAVLRLLSSVPEADLKPLVEQLEQIKPHPSVDKELLEVIELVRRLYPQIQHGVVAKPYTRTAGNFSAKKVQDNIAVSSESSEGLLVMLRYPAGGPSTLLSTLDGLTKKPAKGLCVNVALTYAGLRRSGLQDGTLELFPKEFREGMEKRAGTIGDVGWPNHPDYWHEVDRERRRFSLASIDVVALFHRKGDAPEALERDVKDLLKDFWDDQGVVVHCQKLHRRVPDHFDYLKVPANHPTLPVRPVVVSIPPADANTFDNHIAAGDLFLGHADQHGNTAHCASDRDNKYSHELFRDGTFLVVRKLAQNPAAFARFKAGSGREKESILGTTEPTLKSDQSYESLPADKQPQRDAHLRRVNPRAGFVPRMMRRSFQYTNEGEVGHMFMGYNADIAQQFEVLQRWINGGNSTGIRSSHTDALASQQVSWLLQNGDLEKRRDKNGDLLPDDQGERWHVPHVTLRWGMYLFVPSRVALNYLASVTSKANQAADKARARLDAAERARLETRGAALIARLDAIADSDIALLSWKQLFEESTQQEDSRAVWAAIRARGGRKQTPYGLLVGDSKGAREVLLDDDGSKFSVRGYRSRLLATAGDFYLGIDVKPSCPHRGREAEQDKPDATCPRDYAVLASANKTLRETVPHLPDPRHKDRFRLLEQARQHADRFLAAVDDNIGFDLRDLARQVVGHISQEHIGLPSRFKDAQDDRGMRAFLDHFIYITRYMSFPHPEDWIAERAIDSGKALHAEYGDDPGQWGGLAAHLLETEYQAKDADAIREAVIGANIGFVPPAISMLVGTMNKWIDNGDIEHPTVFANVKTLRDALIRDLSVDATFTTLFRTAVEGNGMTTPGTRVIVGLQSAYEDDKAAGIEDAYTWLFGGTYGAPKHLTHACPMAEQALDVLCGALLALSQHIRKKLANDARCVLMRLGPARFSFGLVQRILPGHELMPTGVIVPSVAPPPLGPPANDPNDPNTPITSSSLESERETSTPCSAPPARTPHGQSTTVTSYSMGIDVPPSLTL